MCVCVCVSQRDRVRESVVMKSVCVSVFVLKCVFGKSKCKSVSKNACENTNARFFTNTQTHFCNFHFQTFQKHFSHTHTHTLTLTLSLSLSVCLSLSLSLWHTHGYFHSPHTPHTHAHTEKHQQSSFNNFYLDFPWCHKLFYGAHISISGPRWLII